MRVVTLVLVTCVGALCACASGFERHGDDDDDDVPRFDAPGGGGGDGGDGGFTVDAPGTIIDAPGTIVDPPMQTDAPTTGGVTCPDTIDYYFRAIDEIANNPNFVDCTSGADCSSSQCCYGQLVCVAYP